MKMVNKILLLRSFPGKGSRKIHLQLKEEMRSREVVDMIAAVLKMEDTRAGACADESDPVERKEVMM